MDDIPPKIELCERTTHETNQRVQVRRLNPLLLIMSQISYHILYPAKIIKTKIGSGGGV